jgi:gluconokinase
MDSQYPRSAYDVTGGIVYFARMLDKIRLHDAGRLPADYHENLGTGFDGRMCGYLQVHYPQLCQRVREGRNDSDETILEWCYEQGRRLEDLDRLIWNGFAAKRGWRDAENVRKFLEESKASCGLVGRDDVQTFFGLFDAEERPS